MFDAEVLAHAPVIWDAPSVLASYRPVSPMLSAAPVSVHLATLTNSSVPPPTLSSPRRSTSAAQRHAKKAHGRAAAGGQHPPPDMIVIGSTDALDGLSALPPDRKVGGADLSLPVEQRLAAAKAHADLKLLRMRAEKEQEMERACTRSPCINAKSRDLMQQSRLTAHHPSSSSSLQASSFGDRLSVHRRRDAPPQSDPSTSTAAAVVAAAAPSTAGKAAAATDGDNATSHLSKPHINDRSAKMAPRGVEAQEKWQETRRIKMELLREQIREEEESKVRRVPQINSRSKEIHDRVKVYKDPELLCLSVEERLLRAQRQREEKLDAERRQVLLAERQAMTPRRTGSHAGDRLYLDAMERERLQEERTRSAEILKFIDESGEILFQPRVNPQSASTAAQRKGGKSLYEYLSTEPSRSDEPSESDDAPSYRPHIGPYSLLLATIAREDGIDTFDRLAKPKTPTAQHRSPTRHGTFSPTLNQRSVRIDARRHSGTTKQRVDLLLQRQEQYDRELEIKKREKERRESELIQQSMQPWIRNPEGSASTPYASVGNVYERMHAWSQRTEAKLQSQRLEKERQEMADCTFQPTVTPMEA